MKNTKSKKKKIAECQKVFEEKIEDLNSELQKSISKLLREQFEEAKNKLYNMKEVIEVIKDSCYDISMYTNGYDKYLYVAGSIGNSGFN